MITLISLYRCIVFLNNLRDKFLGIIYIYLLYYIEKKYNYYFCIIQKIITLN